VYHNLLTDTPFRDRLTTLALRDLGLRQAEPAWSATCQPGGLPASEAVALLAGALAVNCVATSHRGCAVRLAPSVLFRFWSCKPGCHADPRK